MDELSPLTSTSVLVVSPDSSRRDALRTALDGEVGSVLFRRDLPSSLGEMGPDRSVVSTLVLSLDPIDTYPTGLVRSIRDQWPWVSVLLIDAPDSVQMAKSTLKAGAADYLVEDQSTAETISDAVLGSLTRPWRTQIGNVVYTRSVSEGKLIGSSDAVQPMLRRLGVAIDNDLNVLLRGETGTGKTLTARAIHAQSAQPGAPLMQIDCRALRPERARELFLGAAARARSRPDAPGPTTALRDLAGGTLVLDHVDALADEAQEIVAHAMDAWPLSPAEPPEESGAVQFIGIVSSSASLGTVRSDLYHALAELPIFLPPLRERTDDLRPLARHFLRMHAGADALPERAFTEEAVAALRDCSWPGNIRQLENVVKRSVRIASALPLEREDLLLSDAPPSPAPEPAAPTAPSPRPEGQAPPAPERGLDERETIPTPPETPPLDGLSFGDGDSIPSLEELKKQAVKRAYEQFDGDVDRAAVALDIGRSTMYRMIKRHNLRDDDS
jgi:DNA-binding NtrC family response regulator